MRWMFGCVVVAWIAGCGGSGGSESETEPTTTSADTAATTSMATSVASTSDPTGAADSTSTEPTSADSTSAPGSSEGGSTGNGGMCEYVPLPGPIPISGIGPSGPMTPEANCAPDFRTGNLQVVGGELQLTECSACDCTSPGEVYTYSLGGVEPFADPPPCASVQLVPAVDDRGLCEGWETLVIWPWPQGDPYFMASNVPIVAGVTIACEWDCTMVDDEGNDVSVRYMDFADGQIREGETASAHFDTAAWSDPYTIHNRYSRLLDDGKRVSWTASRP